MDLFTILFLIAFVVFPLLQKILAKPEEDLEARPEQPPQVEEPGSWSVDWGEWPEEPVAAEEEAVEALPEEAFSHEVLVPEAVRVASPVVSMEPLHVDHSVDYQRARVRKPPTKTPVARRPKPPSHARTLRDPKGLRRALVLSEILGPPRGLKPHER